MQTTPDLARYLQALTYQDLEDWAGGEIVQRGVNLVSKVKSLGLNEKGTLVGNVQGTNLYFVRVEVDEEGLQAYCTCPYWSVCKHSVALILSAANLLKANKIIPLFQQEQKALPVLEQEVDDEESELTKESLTALKQTLNALTKAKLVSLLIDMVEDSPDLLFEGVQSRASLLSTSEPKKQVATLKKQIDRITAEEGWYDHWNHVGHTPNYGLVTKGLNQLLKQHHYDEVVLLGERLWKRGLQQVIESDDEGETAAQLSDAMLPVLAALPDTSQKPAIQLIWLFDLELEDDYGILQDTDLVYDDKRYVESVWRDVVRVLELRLNKRQGIQSDYYRSQQMLNQMLFALRKLNDPVAILKAQEDHIQLTQDYGQLVDSLMQAGDLEKAKYWICYGYKHTEPRFSGSQSSLKSALCDLFLKQEMPLEAAALLADDYFETPSLNTYKKVEEITTSLSLWPQVREVLLQYLQVARLPEPGRDLNIWPLPVPELTQLNYLCADLVKSTHQTHVSNMLQDLSLKIALYEGRIVDAVQLYQQDPRLFFSDTSFELANQAAATAPDLAISIWLTVAETEIRKTKPKAYQTAGYYLRKVRIILEQHQRLSEWPKLIHRLQSEHKAKKRLQEVLAQLLQPEKKLV